MIGGDFSFDLCNMNKFYKDYSDYLREKFGNVKVQKLSVNAGFTCPNRDGTISHGGCIYCNVNSFTPQYCDPRLSVSEQLHRGKQFFGNKYPEMKYLAYFQSFTATHSRAIDSLRTLYEEAMKVEDIIGLIIGTRPDCLPDAIVELLSELNRKMPIFVEIGAETANDATLEIINRGHKWEDVRKSACRLADCGIDVGLHLIAGLPGEGKNDVLNTLDAAMALPIKSIKFHQLQIIRSTPLAAMVDSKEIAVKPFSLEEYLQLCVEIVERVKVRRPDIALERFLSSGPPELIISPKWGIKNYEFTHKLHKELSALS